MKKIDIRLMGLILVILAAIFTCTACQRMNSFTLSKNTDDLTFPDYGLEISVDEAAPVIEFVPEKLSEDGYREYYLFDDNPEYLNSKYLADGNIPSSISHFEDLSQGIYTVFSYHHRGESVDYNTDLYFDVVFSAAVDSEIEISNLGLDHNWDWNQAWADYTGTRVSMPMFLRTFNCTCGRHCPCNTENGTCIKNNCPAIIRDEWRTPTTTGYDNLNKVKSIRAGERIYLSDFISYISESDLNHFRYGGAVEPMWLMMKFKVKKGAVTFNTIAYKNRESADTKFDEWNEGPFDNEPQYKGIANNAPIVKTELSFDISDDRRNGPLPVTVKNARVPEGYTIPDGTFVTNSNTWREELPIAAESDIMKLQYKDATKLELYGKDSVDKDDIWRFDPFHTKVYGGYSQSDEERLTDYDIPTGNHFQPNSQILDARYPKYGQISTNDFYTAAACNLGNFGVTYKYRVNLSNTGTKNRIFTFEMKSIAGQVYRFRQLDAMGAVIKSDDDCYIMKKFDDDPKEDPKSKEKPKKRLDSALYSDKLEFDIKSGNSCVVEIEVTTLTGCIAPMRNTFAIQE